MTLHALVSDPAYLKVAFGDLGLSEIAGPRHEPRVLEMFNHAGHREIHDDETAWCAAAVGAWLYESGFPNTGSLLAISYAKYGRAVDRNKPLPRGTIAVWHRTGGNHVNIVIADDGTFVTCIGGNQENGRGGGVTISRRRKADALAYRLPVDVPVHFVEPDVPHVADKAEPARIQPEDGPPEDAPKSMASSKIGNAQIAAGSLTAIGAGAQGARSLLETTTETVAQVNDIATQTGTIVETTKVVTTAVPDSFWVSLMHVFTSPEFVAFATVVVITVTGLTWYWRRQHRQAGV